MTFFGAVALIVFELHASHHGRRGRVYCRFATALVAVTCTMLIAANTVLVILANRNNTVLSVALAPVLVLVSVAAHAGVCMEQEQHRPTSTAPRSSYDAAMRAPLIWPLLAPVTRRWTLPCATPPPLHVLRHGDDALRLCAMPLSLLPTPMPEVLARPQERARRASPEERASSPPPELDYPFQVIATVGFTLMTGLYAAFLGTDHYSAYLKAAIFVLLLAVLPSLGRLWAQLHVPQRGGLVGIAGLLFFYPALAVLAAIPLVLMVFVELYQNR
ncbi:hypothetical protein BAE44_0003728 [Dichanthelium oligosanthes]|uniref:Uncharacterized protein n=1 Tax=Dichanthelium oligosanthes TaxID=888268 RepID=A0A1E5WD53_9POAL|nr:hypothetical protein BAE44_0003728 [Dichanthelium oligosanthes]